MVRARSPFSGIRRAVVKAVHVARNGAIDVRYGRPLASRRNSDYRALDRIFGDQLTEADVLVDIGSGNGRVINWWLHRDQPGAFVALEADPELARRTARRHRRRQEVLVLEGDATSTLPADATVAYLFNPGGPDLIEAIEQGLRKLPNLRLVLYYNPKHVATFVEDEAWCVRVADLDAPPDAPVSPLATITPRASDRSRWIPPDG
ncbi:MAG: hypothetical protein AAGK32_00975 [Actinomycetota bacterium]